MALAAIREDADIPAETASHAVSLDGVMVPLRGEEGHKTIDWREASCATVSFHDSDGKRLRTIRHSRMPQSGKLDLKRWLAAEKTHNCGRRADLKLVAIADGAPDKLALSGHAGGALRGA